MIIIDKNNNGVIVSESNAIGTAENNAILVSIDGKPQYYCAVLPLEQMEVVSDKTAPTDFEPLKYLYINGNFELNPEY